MSQNQDGTDTHMFLWIMLLIVVLVVIPAIYAARAGYINGLLLTLAKAQLKAFVPFSGEAQTAWLRISEVDPAALTWDQTIGVLRYTGKWVRWPFLVLLGFVGAVSVFMSRTFWLSRRLNMERLLRNNVESFACLRPVVGRGKYLLSLKSYDSGLWRIARTPLQFALEHGLLLDEHGTPFSREQALGKNGLPSMELPAYGRCRLDEAKTLAALQAQLGTAFTGFEALTPCRRALAAALLAYADGDKNECVGILDAVAISYAEHRGKASSSVLQRESFTERLTTVWERHQEVLRENSLTRHASYELPWCMALLTRARKKGVLASSQFLWLRPMDRPLWYALNQCGGRTAWAEGVAAWTHYVAEEKAGKVLHEPHVAPAIGSLRNSLAAQGWLVDTARVDEAAPDTDVKPEDAPEKPVHAPIVDAPIEPMPDLVLADADDDPELYDANADEELAQEFF